MKTKLLLRLGIVPLSLAPIVTVVACDNSKNKEDDAVIDSGEDKKTIIEFKAEFSKPGFKTYIIEKLNTVFTVKLETFKKWLHTKLDSQGKETYPAFINAIKKIDFTTRTLVITFGDGTTQEIEGASLKRTEQDKKIESLITEMETKVYATKKINGILKKITYKMEIISRINDLFLPKTFNIEKIRGIIKAVFNDKTQNNLIDKISFETPPQVGMKILMLKIDKKPIHLMKFSIKPLMNTENDLILLNELKSNHEFKEIKVVENPYPSELDFYPYNISTGTPNRKITFSTFTKMKFPHWKILDSTNTKNDWKHPRRNVFVLYGMEYGKKEQSKISNLWFDPNKIDKITYLKLASKDHDSPFDGKGKISLVLAWLTLRDGTVISAQKYAKHFSNQLGYDRNHEKEYWDWKYSDKYITKFKDSEDEFVSKINKFFIKSLGEKEDKFHAEPTTKILQKIVKELTVKPVEINGKTVKKNLFIEEFKNQALTKPEQYTIVKIREVFKKVLKSNMGIDYAQLIDKMKLVKVDGKAYKPRPGDHFLFLSLGKDSNGKDIHVDIPIERLDGVSEFQKYNTLKGILDKSAIKNKIKEALKLVSTKEKLTIEEIKKAIGKIPEIRTLFDAEFETYKAKINDKDYKDMINNLTIKTPANIHVGSEYVWIKIYGYTSVKIITYPLGGATTGTDQKSFADLINAMKADNIQKLIKEQMHKKFKEKGQRFKIKSEDIRKILEKDGVIEAKLKKFIPQIYATTKNKGNKQDGNGKWGKNIVVKISKVSAIWTTLLTISDIFVTSS